MHPHVEHLKARVRCPECRTHFHERVHRILHGDRVSCPSCHGELRFHHLPHWHEGEDETSYLRRVEERTAHPHYQGD
jgi:hydrogenase maturation factor HypF (carbamoyltransferase family)